jgi:hypothetical protein
LIPWRTVAFTLAAMAVYSPYPISFFGLGTEPALVSMSFLIFTLALPFTTSLVTSYWFPPSLGERLAAGARTLGVTSIVLAITAQQWGAGGAGGLIVSGMRELDYSRMWFGYAMVAGLALVVDLVGGAIQMAIPRPAGVEYKR